MKIGRFAAIVAFLLFMSVFALSVSASTSVPWYAEKFEKLGFYVFDPPFAFQDFKVTSLAGASVTRASSNGNVVLLNFWATWCPPCKTEIPSIQALSDTLKGKNFQVFAVNLGEPASTVKSFLAKEKISFPVYLDPKNTLARTYASQGIPTTYVLDKQGKFIAGMVGSYDYASPEFISLMTELAAK